MPDQARPDLKPDNDEPRTVTGDAATAEVPRKAPNETADPEPANDARGEPARKVDDVSKGR